MLRVMCKVSWGYRRTKSRKRKVLDETPSLISLGCFGQRWTRLVAPFHLASHACNDASSRSHAYFTTVDQRAHFQGQARQTHIREPGAKVRALQSVQALRFPARIQELPTNVYLKDHGHG